MRYPLIIALFFISITLLAQDNCFENCIENFQHSELPFPGSNFKVLSELKGCTAPDFHVKTIAGETLSLADFRGKVLVLNFWFTSCAPCVAEMPELNRLVEEFKNKDVVFIAFGRDRPDEISYFFKQHHFKYKIVSGDYDMSKSYCIIGGWPMNMVIDKAGKVSLIFSGGAPEGTEDFIYQKLRPVIVENLSQ